MFGNSRWSCSFVRFALSLCKPAPSAYSFAVFLVLVCSCVSTSAECGRGRGAPIFHTVRYSVCFMIVEAGVRFSGGLDFLTPATKIHRTGVVEMSFPSGARAAVGLPSVPPQRLIRNDCSSRDTRSRGCTANLRHKIAKGAVAQDSEHIRSCTLSH